MRIGFNFAGLRNTAVHEYAIRFLFGGSITVIAGLVAKAWGPELAGLLLAFPAIFPASATLLERHQIKRKRKAGRNGARRGREAAALDAAGAAMGSVGLAAFGLILWRLLPGHSSLLVLPLAALVWFAVSFTIWRLCEARSAARRLIALIQR